MRAHGSAEVANNIYHSTSTASFCAGVLRALRPSATSRRLRPNGRSHPACSPGSPATSAMTDPTCPRRRPCPRHVRMVRLAQSCLLCRGKCVLQKLTVSPALIPTLQPVTAVIWTAGSRSLYTSPRCLERPPVPQVCCAILSLLQRGGLGCAMPPQLSGPHVSLSLGHACAFALLFVPLYDWVAASLNPPYSCLPHSAGARPRPPARTRTIDG